MSLLCQKRADILKFPILCKFSLICLLGQKVGDIFKFAVFAQNSVRNKELQKISVCSQKREESNNLQNFLTV